MNGVSGVPVAQVILDQPEIVPPVRQAKAAGVPQHVWVRRQQGGRHRRGGDQVIDRLPGQRLALSSVSSALKSSLDLMASKSMSEAIMSGF